MFPPRASSGERMGRVSARSYRVGPEAGLKPERSMTTPHAPYVESAGGNRWALCCPGCGARKEGDSPIRVSAFLALMDGFRRAHAGCAPSPGAA